MTTAVLIAKDYKTVVFETEANNVILSTGIIRYQTRYFHLTKVTAKTLTFVESTVVDLPKRGE